MHSATVILLVAFSPLLIKAANERIPGAPVPAQLSEQRRNELINYSMDAYHKQSNSAYQHKVVKVNSITSQVVSGALYNLKMEIGETDCRKGTAGQTCNLRTPAKHLNCEFTIHEQPWLNHRAVTVKSCTPKS